MHKLLKYLANASISQSVILFISLSVGQSAFELISQSLNQSVSSITLSMYQQVNQFSWSIIISQSINLKDCKSVIRSIINLTVDYSVSNQSVGEAINSSIINRTFNYLARLIKLSINPSITSSHNQSVSQLIN